MTTKQAQHLAIAAYNGGDRQVRLLARRYLAKEVSPKSRKLLKSLIEHGSPAQVAIEVYWEVRG